MDLYYVRAEVWGCDDSEVWGRDKNHVKDSIVAQLKEAGLKVGFAQVVDYRDKNDKGMVIVHGFFELEEKRSFEDAHRSLKSKLSSQYSMQTWWRSTVEPDGESVDDALLDEAPNSDDEE